MSEHNDRVQVALDQLVADGPELGLQMAVYQDGELIVDAVAGSADPHTKQPVDERTLFWASSTGKGVVATCMHLLAERGKLDYEAPVAQYWPEFGASGKQGVTVRHVLSHKAGVPNPPEGYGLAEFLDWDRTAAAIAGLPPMWEPGTKTGYHNYTFGFITGELIRRIDGRPLTQFLAEEILQPLGIDSLFFGVPDGELDRVATRVPDNVFNQREFRQACIPSSGLYASARALARFYALLAQGGELDGVKLLSPERLRVAAEVQTNEMDVIWNVQVKRSLGYRIGDDTGPGAGPRAFGHVGASMMGYADPDARRAVAFVKNYIDSSSGWDTAESAVRAMDAKGD